MLCDRLKYLTPLSQPVKSIIQNKLQFAFPAWRYLQVFGSGSDWFIELSASLVLVFVLRR